MRHAILFVTILSFCVLGVCAGCLAAGRNVEPPVSQAEMSNATLKSYHELSDPDYPRIKKLLTIHDFKALDQLFSQRLALYEKDVRYEWLLQDSYNIFTPDEGIAAEDLDAWIEETDSFIAYGTGDAGNLCNLLMF